MVDSKNKLFDQIEKNSNVSSAEIVKIAQSLQHANFKDERVVRNLVRNLANLAGKPVSQAKEDKIVETIVNNKMPTDLQTLQKLMKG
ncbi:stage VI sporulation protein F [Saliterribacillus persicus]|uniref:Stage VI sporulation protein F n=1 Tax=Saliterribacillus persicus TaxID=930114 RepID=A0A368XAM4_9BACI|nr:stage VI sporulation protein F [Saliterribacillus persicus]RCW64905.1 stage VI sporulation protein F [Saliterribacillus persicus]